MERIIEKPHLPEGEVRYVIIGKKYEKRLKNALNSNNIEVICAENNNYVDERLSGHVDLSILHIGKNRIIAIDQLFNGELFNELSAFGFEVKLTHNPINTEYPNDVRLNMCIIDDKVICNPTTAAMGLIAHKHVIKCKQGYTKCSVTVVDEHSIITSDKLIAQNSALYGIEALLIDDCFVRLPGFNKGFIGGAAFKISKDKIAFTGVIEAADRRKQIEAFLNQRGVKAVYLTDEPIFDIGGAIPIIEEI